MDIEDPTAVPAEALVRRALLLVSDRSALIRGLLARSFEAEGRVRVLLPDAQPTLPDRTPSKMLTNVNKSAAIRADCWPAAIRFPASKMLANVGFSAAALADHSLASAGVVLSKMWSNVDISAAIPEGCDVILEEELRPTLLDAH